MDLGEIVRCMSRRRGLEKRREREKFGVRRLLWVEWRRIYMKFWVLEDKGI